MRNITIRLASVTLFVAASVWTPLRATEGLPAVAAPSAERGELKPTDASATPDRPASSIDVPLPTPGMGWSTYNYFGARHSDKLLRQMGDAFTASGLREAGYTMIRIDGGWWGNDSDRRWWYWTEDGKYEGGQRYKPGDPHVDPKNYPGGLRPLADYLY